MKLARRKILLSDEFARIELPAIDVGIPRVPRDDRGHAIAQLRRNDFRDDERFLAPELVRVSELESEHAKDVAGDVPGRLRVPAVRDLHNDAEAVGKLGMLDGEAEEAV